MVVEVNNHAAMLLMCILMGFLHLWLAVLVVCESLLSTAFLDFGNSTP
jgi:hypothetical protein